jgi:cytochrome c oxidase assembly protein subunit 15
MVSLVALLIMQIASGILTVATGLSLAFSLLHSLVITLIFGVLSYIMLLNSRSKSVEKKVKNNEVKRVS